MDPKAHKFKENEIAKILELDVIKTALTECTSPIVFTSRRDYMLCVNYNKLSAVTLRDSYPNPFIDGRIASFGDATMFSTLVSSSARGRAQNAKGDRAKTAFASNHYTSVYSCAV